MGWINLDQGSLLRAQLGEARVATTAVRFVRAGSPSGFAPARVGDFIFWIASLMVLGSLGIAWSGVEAVLQHRTQACVSGHAGSAICMVGLG